MSKNALLNCLNLDFNKIFMIAMIEEKNPENLFNPVKIMVQTFACLSLHSSLACSLAGSLAQGTMKLRDKHDAEPEAVVSVVGIVGAAIRGAAILSVAVPVAAAKHVGGA